MFIKSKNPTTKEIKVAIPLTTTSGKTRVKVRTIFDEYGLPFASRQNPFTQNNYIEWQIGYDSVLDNEKKLALSTLSDVHFQAYNGKTKAFYELSEYLYYFYQWEVFSTQELKNLIEFLENLEEKDLIENRPDSNITRTHPKEVYINGLKFKKLQIAYPLLIHQFGDYEIISEIVIKEKQRAAGVQAMLYFCFQIMELESEINLVGRIAEKKEFGYFTFNPKNSFIILEMIKIFGMLSKSHRADVVAILKRVMN
jgi:R.Pab1 restriction endonuclease